MLRSEPVDRSSMPVTRSPRAISASARCDPMNPAPPVIRYLIVLVVEGVAHSHGTLREPASLLAAERRTAASLPRYLGFHQPFLDRRRHDARHPLGAVRAGTAGDPQNVRIVLVRIVRHD